MTGGETGAGTTSADTNMADTTGHPAGPAATTGGPGSGPGSAAVSGPPGSAAVSGPPGSGRRYLLGADDDALLGQVTDVLVSTGHGRVVRRPAAGTVVVEVADAVADDVRRLFANRVVVEPDLELDPMPPAGPVPGPGEPTSGAPASSESTGGPAPHHAAGETALDKGDHDE